MNSELAQRDSSAPVTLVVTTPEGFKEAVDHFGILLAPYQAAIIANVSKQRIYNLIEQGKFTKIVLFGMVHISQIEFERWAKSPRMSGRPRSPGKK
jgi:hypothetical protein